jgi:uncharacterized membrane protein
MKRTLIPTVCGRLHPEWVAKTQPKITLAFLAYLLSIPGWLYVLLFRREDEFAMYHAKQSLGLTIAAIGAPVAWALVAWIISWVPLVGPVVAAATFALVILAYIVLFAVWIVGMVYALRGRARPVPVFGRWAERLTDVRPMSAL